MLLRDIIIFLLCRESYKCSVEITTVFDKINIKKKLKKYICIYVFNMYIKY